MTSWKILETQPKSAEQNMLADRNLLQDLETSGQPVLHFYEWDGPSATYGHFIDPQDHLDMQGVERHQLQLSRRPTGGGIIFHVSDFAFSVIVPASYPGYSINTLENYAFINQAVAKSVQEFLKGTINPILLQNENVAEDSSYRNFCMAHPTKYDVVVDGRKVGGAAQRRTKFGYLHQGSIALALPAEGFLRDVLLKDKNVVQAMQQQSYSLLGPGWTSSQLREGKSFLRDLLKKHLTAQVGVVENSPCS